MWLTAINTLYPLLSLLILSYVWMTRMFLTTIFLYSFLDTEVCGFELVSLQVFPERPKVGDDVHLQCFYQLDQGEQLYSLKWNRKDSNDEDKEFYRFSSRRPVKQKFSLADLDIDVSKIHLLGCSLFWTMARDIEWYTEKEGEMREDGVWWKHSFHIHQLVIHFYSISSDRTSIEERNEKRSISPSLITRSIAPKVFLDLHHPSHHFLHLLLGVHFLTKYVAEQCNIVVSTHIVSHLFSHMFFKMLLYFTVNTIIGWESSFKERDWICIRNLQMWNNGCCNLSNSRQGAFTHHFRYFHEISYS